MRIKVLAFAVSCLLLSISSAGMPQSTNSTTTTSQTATQRDPIAVNILAKTQAALTAASISVQDALLQGTYTDAAGNTGTITTKCKGSALLRNELSLNGISYIAISNNGRGQATQDGKTQKLPLWTTQYLRPEEVPAFWRLADFTLPTTNVIYLGLEQVNGSSAYHIKLTSLPTDGTPPDIEAIISEFHVFIDSQTGLVLKTWSYDFSPVIIENRTLVETYFGDYRQINGVVIPFHTVRFVAGQKFNEIVLSFAQVNSGVSDAEFQLQ
jgi:hypothetical protein